MKSNLFLPSNYVCNAQSSIDSNDSAFWMKPPSSYTLSWQRPAYEAAELFAKKNKIRKVLDVGCGTGYKLSKVFGERGYQVLGLDQKSGITFARQAFPDLAFQEIDLDSSKLPNVITDYSPGLITCFDVIEHLQDPIRFLSQLHAGACTTDSWLVFSTPNRDALYGTKHLGPPKNSRHVCEWSKDEFSSLLVDNRFKVFDVEDLEPRTYSFDSGEVLRFISRLLFRRRTKEGRTCMLFIVKPI